MRNGLFKIFSTSCALLMGLALAPGQANAVNVSIGVGGEVLPGVYGSVNIDNGRYPALVYAEPLIVSRAGTVLLGPPDVQGSVLKLASLDAAERGERGNVWETWPDGKHSLVGYSSDSGFGTYPGLGWRVRVRQELGEAAFTTGNFERAAQIIDARRPKQEAAAPAVAPRSMPVALTA